MSDLIEELGALGLGSRLKRLSDQLMQDGAKIYAQLDENFEPRWFPVFVYLYRRGPTAITDLARGLGVSHPAINKIADELIEAKLAAPYRDRNDKRKRVLALTTAGRDKYESLEPRWRQIRQALQSALDDGGGELLRWISRLEKSLSVESFYDRFQTCEARTSPEIQIRNYLPELSHHFADLNTRWIQQFFAMEDADRKVLENPEGTILADGGEIFFAVDISSGEVLGTCALVAHPDGSGELAKMAVAESGKGLGIGRLLGDAVINLSRERGYSHLWLESNKKLTPAISLYRTLGFVELPFPHETDYERADIYMSLSLN